MSRLTMQERMRIASLGAQRSRRALLSRALNSRALRWRYGAPRVDQLLIVPQDLRTADPSFWVEVHHGEFGLSGTRARTDGNSPFAIPPPNRGWMLSLHGFGWLRHLAAAEDPAAARFARDLAVEWTVRQARGSGQAWQPEVLARRVISWLSHANLLLDGADEETYNIIATSLGQQLVRLSSAWREAPAGQGRLLAAIALVLADLCIAGRDRRYATDLSLMTNELSSQIRSDGGHASRNPVVVVELLHDLLPLGQCFRARGREQPASLLRLVEAMLSGLQQMRLGDGLLARFNGVAVAVPSRLATVFAYADTAARPRPAGTASGYRRLEAGQVVVIADCGGPPPLELAAIAHAGCLSFELSSGTAVILSNGGAPGSADADWLPSARATASHNTLVLGDTSSSRLVGNRRVEEMFGTLPIRGPDHVMAQAVDDTAGVCGWEASHDGYLAEFGMLHERRLVLDDDGRRLSGMDRLGPPRGVLRLKRDVPFAIHFHLHPGVTVARGEKVGSAIVTAPGQRWNFVAEGARLGIEESTYYAHSTGPSRRLQIVLRGATFGETEVRWVLRRLS